MLVAICQSEFPKLIDLSSLFIQGFHADHLRDVLDGEAVKTSRTVTAGRGATVAPLEDVSEDTSVQLEAQLPDQTCGECDVAMVCLNRRADCER